MSTPYLALRDAFSGGDIEGGEHSGGAVSDIVMRDALDLTEPHWQQRLRALQSLALTHSVPTQHNGAIRWIEIKRHDVASLLDEEGIFGTLEGLLPVWLHAEDLEPPLPCSLGNDPYARPWSSPSNGSHWAAVSQAPCRLRRRGVGAVRAEAHHAGHRSAIWLSLKGLAMGLLFSASALASTVSARRTMPCGSERERAMAINCSKLACLGGHDYVFFVWC